MGLKDQMLQKEKIIELVINSYENIQMNEAKEIKMSKGLVSSGAM